MGKLTSLPLALSPARAALTCSSSTSHTVASPLSQQVRHATFIPRPRRPYTFTQLVQLSDGSTYTMRTTSPQPLYRPTKDTRNTLTWQPSERSLRNVELDEAGKLAAFRERFGRGFDAAQVSEEEALAAVDAEGGDVDAAAAKKKADMEASMSEDDLSSLITGYAAGQNNNTMKDVKPKDYTKKR